MKGYSVYVCEYNQYICVYKIKKIGKLLILILVLLNNTWYNKYS